MKINIMVGPVISLFTSTLFMSPLVLAQQQVNQTPAKGVNRLIEEVLVTAQKKAIAERSQDVPIAISAYSGDKVEAMFAVDVTDIGLTSPNVSLTPLLPGVGNFSIRGMGTVGQSIPSSDPAVGIVVDGISYGTIYGVLFDLFDVKSVEILRGPQGTLFGRNVTGGAVVLRTARPTDEFEGKVKTTLGSNERMDVMASVSGPLTENFSAKMALLSKSHGDFWDREYSNGGAGKYESLVVRPALRYQSDALDITTIAEVGNVNADGNATRNFYLDGIERNPYGNNESTQAKDGENDLEWKSLTLEANVDVANGVVTTVAGYRELEQNADFDIDGDPNAARFHFAPGTGMKQNQSSLEIRWAGDISDNVNLSTGMYYFEQEYDYRERRLVAQVLDRRGASHIDHSTYGFFAQSDIQLTDAVTLTLGGRYTSEKKDGDIGVIGDPNATGDCTSQSGPPFEDYASLNDCETVFSDSETWSNFAPKLGVSWQVNENLMAYTSYTRGFRSGGYNVRFTDLTFVTNPRDPSSTPGPYDEEVVDAYEIGMKSDWMGNRLRLNLALFYNEFDDLQRTALNASGGQQILNAATAEIQGVEFEGVFLITEQLALEGSYGWVDAQYVTADFLEVATGRPASSFDFTMVPENTRNLALTYFTELDGIGSINTRLSYVFVDSSKGDDFNRAEMSQYELYDASISLTTVDETLRVSLFGKNLKDEIYTNYISDTSSLGTKSLFLAPPRTYGIELTYNF